MKTNFLKPVIFIMVILFFSGCTVGKKTTPIDKKLIVSLKSGGCYYYFTEAQLQKKKGNLVEAVEWIKRAIKCDPESIYLQKELATFYLQQKENIKALSIVERVVKKYPDDVEALILYGGIKQSLKYIDDAKKAYKKIITNDPKQKNIYLILGEIYMEEGNIHNALQVYDQLVKNFPDSYAGHFFIGKIYAKQGNIIDAEREFQKTLELKPALEEPRFELLKLYENLGKENKIPEIYKDILERNPKNIRAATGLACFYHKNGMPDYAAKLLKELGAQSLFDPEIIRKVAQLYLNQKKYDDALIILKGMLQGVPDSSDIHYLAGMIFNEKNDQNMAIMHFKKVIPDSGFYQNAVVHISFIYQKQGKIEEAINFLKDVIKKLPDKPEFKLYLGTFYEEVEKFEKAAAVFKQGLEIDPDNIELHFRLGIVYDKLNRKEASIKAMKTVIGLDPENANALNYLGYTYADMGENLDEAEHLIKEALKHKPDDGYITDSLGWVYFKKGLFKKAIKLLKKAVSLTSDDSIILEHLGDAYMKLNNKKKALEFYERSFLKRKDDMKEDEKKDLEKKIQKLKNEN